MNRMTGMALALALVWVAPAAAQGRGPAGEHRREELEARVRGQFMAQVADRLGLTAEQRAEVQSVLRESAESRRELAEAGRGLRRDLMAAVRDEDAPVSAFDGLLARMQALREREQELARLEDDRLAEVLDARQHAIFLFLRMQLNDRIRGMRGPPRGAGPGRPPLMP